MNNPILGKFVKKFVTEKEWKEFYSQNSIYTDLGRAKGGRYVGFLIVGEKTPNGCLECNEGDIEKILRWRERLNIFPR